MRSLLNNDRFHGAVAAAVKERWGRGNWTRRAYPIFQDSYKDRLVAWPLPNVWLGVSVEDQDTAELRIPALLDTPAAVRWLSCEPLLGPVDLFARSSIDRGPGLDWIVVGGESGPGARPMHPAWARFLRDQCEGAGIPFLFKQWGEWAPTYDGDHRVAYSGGPAYQSHGCVMSNEELVARVGKKAAGRTLDGQLHDGYPQDVTV